MRRELDQLELPADYVLIEEQASGSRMGWFGEHPTYHRAYRAPRDIEPTCEEIERAVRSFADPLGPLSKRTGGVRTTCSIVFKRKAFEGGILASGRPTAETVERLGLEGPHFVKVHVRLYD